MNTDRGKYMERLMELLDCGVTASHVIEYMKKELVKEKGFVELELEETFSIEENKGYYVNLYGTNGIKRK